MMPSASSEVLDLGRRGPGFCGALVIGQVVFLACLLRLSVGAAVLFALLAGLPLAMACYGLLARAGERRGVRLTVVMFAAGGFGMLLGCIVDFGPMGLYGLLGMCRSWSTDMFWPAPEQLWLTIGLMPWACVGMLAGSNVGMAVFDALHHRRARSAVRAIGLYGICNLGMLLGMVMAEHAITRLTNGLSEITAGMLVMTAMLAGMAAGMGVVLALVARLLRVASTFGRIA